MRATADSDSCSPRPATLALTHAWLAAVTDAQLAIMRGPDRDAADHNVPRLDVAAGGDIDVIYDKGSTLYSNATPTGPVAAEVKAEVASAEAAPAKARL